ncbi:redoxin domain-containing protein [Paenibacillus sp. PR3]|uniref:Redoxin domain-containing protein n=1 Tax=Paenibacillus terricola TaxID=2763503 RepID=A0ABR8N1F9_9BACL|nr:redoxin domain-containing protein [Paenibacillus terricola]MBD3921376.1 redoxin domain-containing protein [Paenibacillus terricola]
MKKSIIGVFVLLALVAYGLYQNKTAGSGNSSTDAQLLQQTDTGTRKGEQAPDFELKDLGGNAVRLSDYRGRTVFINFWATWCPPCKAEMPHMERVYKDYAARDVVILSVNLTTTEAKASDVDDFVSEYGLTFPVVLDEAGIIKRQYKVTAYPTTYVIDKNGIIRNKYAGAINDEIMTKAIRQLE